MYLQDPWQDVCAPYLTCLVQNNLLSPKKFRFLRFYDTQEQDFNSAPSEFAFLTSTDKRLCLLSCSDDDPPSMQTIHGPIKRFSYLFFDCPAYVITYIVRRNTFSTT